MRGRAFALGAACLASLLVCLHYRQSVIDDAYIVFRYADHLLAGLGPVFNPGERVEGFTSPLWLLLVAAARAAGLAGETAVGLLGAACAVAAVLATWALARRVAPGWPAVLAAAFLAVHPAHGMWAVHGLETALYTTLLALALARWGDPRGALSAGLLLGLAFWTRPEAPLFGLLLAGSALVRRQPRRAAHLLAGLAALALPLLAARFLYYGTLVPNTFHAKTGGLEGRLLFGLGYARLFLQTHLVLAMACAAAALAAARRPAPPLVLDLALCGTVWSAWVVWIGGDAFPGYRFFVPVLPPAAALAAWGLSRLADRRLAAAAAAALVLSAGLALPDVAREARSGREFTARMLAVGTWLRGHAPEGATIALNYVGAVPYRSGLRAIDMLGLTDAEVARTPIRGRFRFPGHARGNGASILDRRPHLILMGGVYLAEEPMGELHPELDSEEQIAADPRFAREYARKQVRIDGPSGKMWFAFYQRKGSP